MDWISDDVVWSWATDWNFLDTEKSDRSRDTSTDALLMADRLSHDVTPSNVEDVVMRSTRHPTLLPTSCSLSLLLLLLLAAV